MQRAWAAEEGVQWQWKGNLAYWRLCQYSNMLGQIRFHILVSICLLAGWLARLLPDRLGWVGVGAGLAGWLAGLAGWLAGLLAGCLAGWLPGWLAG